MVLEQTEQKPFAIRKLVRQKDGTLAVVYIDPRTGQRVQNLSDYNVVDNNNNVQPNSLGLDPQQASNSNTFDDSRDEKNSSVADKVVKSSITENNNNNNYHYINKPTGLGAGLSTLGGMPGKIINTGINLNNEVSINNARQDLGLQKNKISDVAKGAIFGTKDGRVADVRIGGQDYIVGLEDVDNYGAATITPQQAIEKSKELGAPITETQIRDQKLTDPFSVFTGNVKNAVGSVTGFLEDLFNGGKQDDYSDWGLTDYPVAPKSDGSKSTNDKSDIHEDNTTLGEFLGYSPSKNSSDEKSEDTKSEKSDDTNSKETRV